ncbi:hypothetical protein BC828DRAFT_377546 [Blastocladiella britannica]|nr:hypothetical protein BC828DRAFT_377546 [Blastocladiella britannica]
MTDVLAAVFTLAATYDYAAAAKLVLRMPKLVPPSLAAIPHSVSAAHGLVGATPPSMLGGTSGGGGGSSVSGGTNGPGILGSGSGPGPTAASTHVPSPSPSGPLTPSAAATINVTTPHTASPGSSLPTSSPVSVPLGPLIPAAVDAMAALLTTYLRLEAAYTALTLTRQRRFAFVTSRESLADGYLALVDGAEHARPLLVRATDVAAAVLGNAAAGLDALWVSGGGPHAGTSDRSGFAAVGRTVTTRSWSGITAGSSGSSSSAFVLDIPGMIGVADPLIHMCQTRAAQIQLWRHLAACADIEDVVAILPIAESTATAVDLPLLARLSADVSAQVEREIRVMLALLRVERAIYHHSMIDALASLTTAQALLAEWRQRIGSLAASSTSPSSSSTGQSLSPAAAASSSGTSTPTGTSGQRPTTSTGTSGSNNKRTSWFGFLGSSGNGLSNTAMLPSSTTSPAHLLFWRQLARHYRSKVNLHFSTFEFQGQRVGMELTESIESFIKAQRGDTSFHLLYHVAGVPSAELSPTALTAGGAGMQQQQGTATEPNSRWSALAGNREFHLSGYSFPRPVQFTRDDFIGVVSPSDTPAAGSRTVSPRSTHDVGSPKSTTTAASPTAKPPSRVPSPAPAQPVQPASAQFATLYTAPSSGTGGTSSSDSSNFGSGSGDRAVMCAAILRARTSTRGGWEIGDLLPYVDAKTRRTYAIARLGEVLYAVVVVGNGSDVAACVGPGGGAGGNGGNAGGNGGARMAATEMGTEVIEFLAGFKDQVWGTEVLRSVAV